MRSSYSLFLEQRLETDNGEGLVAALSENPRGSLRRLDDPKNRVRIRHLLTHTSGMADDPMPGP